MKNKLLQEKLTILVRASWQQLMLHRQHYLMVSKLPEKILKALRWWRTHIHEDEYLTGLRYLEVTGYFNTELIAVAILGPVKLLLKMKGSWHSTQIALIQRVCFKKNVSSAAGILWYKTSPGCQVNFTAMKWIRHAGRWKHERHASVF